MLSVIVRTVERVDRLREALESLAAQSRRDFEVVVVDMSRGKASSVIKDLKRRVPALVHVRMRWRVLSRPAALNAGIKRASGQYIAILDDDNCWEPSHTESILAAVEKSGADLVYTGVRRVGLTPDGNTTLQEDTSYEPFDAAKLLRGNYIYSSATTFRKSIWCDVGGYDEAFPVYEDWEFLIRATRGRAVVSLPEFSAISSNFTGRFLVPEHSLNEADDCARCLAAIRSKHGVADPQ